VLIALIIVAIVAVKYRAFPDLLFIFLSTLTGFIIGLLWHSPISMGFAMMSAVAGLLVSITIDVGARLLARIWKFREANRST
jgi:uncharacterized protein YqgC (DUF456 family)